MDPRESLKNVPKIFAVGFFCLARGQWGDWVAFVAKNGVAGGPDPPKDSIRAILKSGFVKVKKVNFFYKKLTFCEEVNFL